MSEAVLTLLKFCFLALLYLFLYRVVRVVIMELRAPRPALETAGAPAPAPPAKRERRAEPRGALRLRVLEPPARQGEILSLTEELTIGRGGGCGMVLTDDSYVSQLHARLYSQGNDPFVEDLGSTNGTYVNGQRIDTPTKLKRGDQVQFGQTVAEVIR
jgi:pSer/pThr/pTyr-binding forkhead associated (FHA) protein